jgi:uncharacterized protein YozE (UPF0346 family)
MEKLINNAFEPSVDFHDGASLNNKIIYQHGLRQIQKEGIMGIAMPKLTQLYILRHERATLIDSCTIMFGNECTRLVNIAFHTSKMFPSMMNTYATISQYLQKELQRRHPKKHFHIIIAENDAFSFAISDYDHFADIKQEQYRVLIFSTKSHNKIKIDTHDVNNQMKLQWKSVVFKRIDN